MTIQIPISEDGKVSLVSDGRTFGLAKLERRKDRRDAWEWFAWFPDPGAAVREAFRLELAASEAKTFAELTEDAKRILARLCACLRPYFDVIEKESRG